MTVVMFVVVMRCYVYDGDKLFCYVAVKCSRSVALIVVSVLLVIFMLSTVILAAATSYFYWYVTCMPRHCMCGHVTAIYVFVCVCCF